MSPTKFNAMTPVARGVWYIVVAVFALGGVYATTMGDIGDLKMQVAENVKTDKQITATVNSIRTEQAVIKIKLEQSEDRSREFRKQANKALDRILDKLDK